MTMAGKATTADRDGRRVAAAPEGRLARCWPELLGAAVPLVFAACFLNLVPSPDVAWQLWISHQLRMGARLYIDIIETNPPLWFWEGMPLDWVAALLRIPSHVLLVAAVGSAASLSIFTTGRLLRHVVAPWRAALLVYMALTLVLTPLIDTGQREQFALIGALPYLVLAAARREGRTVAPALAAAIGGAACFGLALKHYFLIAPALIELWLLITLRRNYRPLRPETVTAVALGVLYGVAIQAITPEFLTRIVPLNRIAYAHLGAAGFWDMIRPIQIYWLIALAPLVLQLGLLRRSPLASAALIAALGFGLGWLVQFKGFPYQSIPVSGCLIAALACFVVENRHRLGFLTWVTVPTILLIPLGFPAWYGPFRDDYAPIVRPMLKGVDPHAGVAFVSDQAIFAWPLSLYRPAPYPSRQYGMWIMAAVASDHGRTPALVAMGRQLVEQAAQDYRCAQPVRIILSRRPIHGVEPARFFLADPAFGDLMGHYRFIGAYRIFDVYQLRAPFPRPPASACRRSF